MKKFIIKLLYCLIPVGIVVISINYVVDPAKIFHVGAYEQEIAKYLSKGMHVTNVSNYNARLLQKYFIEDLSYEPDIIILTSSRGSMINNNIIKKGRIINNFVMGASLEDYLAIYDLYEKKGFRPKKVFIVLDPYMLNENNNQKRWESIEENYLSMCKKINIPSVNSQNPGLKGKEYLQIFSLSYFQNALKAYLKEGTDMLPTTVKYNEGYTILNDGSQTYPTERREADSLSVMAKAHAYIKTTPIYSLGQFAELSNKYIVTLEAFVSYLKKNNIKVEIIFIPYHPVVYDFIKTHKSYQSFFSAEKYFVSLAEKEHINYLGSYNPNDFHIGNDYFYDGMHCKEKFLKLIFTKN